MTSELAAGESSTIEWLEPFFDLVVIAAIALLSHGLREEPTWFGLGIFLVLYAAIWMTWVNVVLYADVAGEQTRVLTVLGVMLLVATMAATSPLHHEDRANAFAIAFLVARLIISRRSMSRGQVLSSWPQALAPSGSDTCSSSSAGSRFRGSWRCGWTRPGSTRCGD